MSGAGGVSSVSRPLPETGSVNIGGGHEEEDAARRMTCHGAGERKASAEIHPPGRFRRMRALPSRGLGGKMHHNAGLMPRNDALHRRLVRYVGLLAQPALRQARAAFEAEDHAAMMGKARGERGRQVAANKAGAPCEKDGGLVRHRSGLMPRQIRIDHFAESSLRA